MTVDPIKIEKITGSIVIRFTRPELRNPLSIDVLKRLHENIGKIAVDPNVKRLIFTGTGYSFASGADLREISAIKSETASEFAIFGQQLMKKIEGLDQLTVAAVNGYCFGGALDLALSCKKRIASPPAKFAHPGTGLGIITGWGGTQRLPRLIGLANTFEMFFTAQPVDATRALAIGLVDEIADDPLQRALQFVESG